MSDTDVTGTSGDTDEAGAAVRVDDAPRVTDTDDEAADGPASVDDLDDDDAEDSEEEDSGDDDDSEEEDEPEEEDSEDDDDSEDDESDEEGEQASSGARRSRRSPSVKRLEEEGEVAADYLEELLDITDLDGDIDIDVENGRASVAIVAEGPDRELRRLVGGRGEVLEALQELSRLAVQARTGERSRLMLDVAGFRAARRRVLEEVAAKACDEVVRSGQPLRMDPMSAFERKVVHDVVAGAGLRSESEGEEPSRRVVVFPAS